MPSTLTLDIDLADAGHVCLRAWRHDDFDALVAHADTSVRFPYPYAGGDGRGWLDAAVCDPRGRWALELDGRVVGGVSLHAEGESVSELGYWLGRDYWQRGIMTRVIARFAPEAMRAFHLQRLFATAYADNPASMRVLEKAGFECEGVRSSAFATLGESLDLVVYARVRRALGF